MHSISPADRVYRGNRARITRESQDHRIIAIIKRTDAYALLSPDLISDISSIVVPRIKFASSRARARAHFSFAARTRVKEHKFAARIPATLGSSRKIFRETVFRIIRCPTCTCTCVYVYMWRSTEEISVDVTARRTGRPHPVQYTYLRMPCRRGDTLRFVCAIERDR